MSVIHVPYPLVSPKAKRSKKYRKSEFIMGVDGEKYVVEDTLHRRNKGMKSVRSRENITRWREDHIASRGIEQRYRDSQSPELNTTKWREMKSAGEKNELVESRWTERIELVIGGKIT